VIPLPPPPAAHVSSIVQSSIHAISRALPLAEDRGFLFVSLRFFFLFLRLTLHGYRALCQKGDETGCGVDFLSFFFDRYLQKASAPVLLYSSGFRTTNRHLPPIGLSNVRHFSSTFILSRLFFSFVRPVLSFPPSFPGHCGVCNAHAASFLAER